MPVLRRTAILKNPENSHYFSYTLYFTRKMENFFWKISWKAFPQAIFSFFISAQVFAFFQPSLPPFLYSLPSYPFQTAIRCRLLKRLQDNYGLLPLCGLRGVGGRSSNGGWGYLANCTAYFGFYFFAFGLAGWSG